MQTNGQKIFCFCTPSRNKAKPVKRVLTAAHHVPNWGKMLHLASKHNEILQIASTQFVCVVCIYSQDYLSMFWKIAVAIHVPFHHAIYITRFIKVLTQHQSSLYQLKAQKGLCDRCFFYCQLCTGVSLIKPKQYNMYQEPSRENFCRNAVLKLAIWKKWKNWN